MIRILKPETPPDVLTTRGREETNTLCAAYATGTRDFRFRPDLYGHTDVKQALITAQHGKCCFCESKICDDGDVEHFRPKAGVRQAVGNRLIKPGYYWLAYDWTNLFLCCTACNCRHKRNLFPLENPDERAQTHDDDLQRERPLFVHPVLDNPAEHINFVRHDPVSVNNSLRGQATIRHLKLDTRQALIERRLTLWRIMDRLLKLLEIASELERLPGGKAILTYARKEIIALTADTAEYSAMTRAALPRFLSGT